MRHQLTAAAALLALACGAPPRDDASTPDDSLTLRISGPTLVAVVPHTPGFLDSNVVDADEDTTGLTTALDDFSFYLGVTDSAMRARGVQVHLRIDTLIRWVANGRRDSMRFTPDSGVAYLFFSPAGPRVRRGVMTDIDLLAFADSGLVRR